MKLIRISCVEAVRKKKTNALHLPGQARTTQALCLWQGPVEEPGWAGRGNITLQQRTHSPIHSFFTLHMTMVGWDVG